MELVVLSYPSDEAFNCSFQHDGEEMLFVLQRKIRFKCANRELVLEEGDCVYLYPSTLHTGDPLGDE
jgi:mannose-6-phosphate isomerase-like protein (cupin superfamily)